MTGVPGGVALRSLGIIPSNDPQQALRVRRFLLAQSVYGLAAALLALYVVLGLLAPGHFLLLLAAFLAVNGLFFALLRSGRNRRLDDPSMTVWQMIGACALMSLSLYLVDGGRGALLLLTLALLLFGTLRLSTADFLLVGMLAPAGYALALAAAVRYRGVGLDLRLELLQLLALTALIPCCAAFAGYVAGLRRSVRQASVDLARARETIHDLSVLDELTGVSNRRSILNLLEDERVRSDRLEQELAVAVLDLDNFKQVNQTHGRDVGDQALRRLARRLREAVRAVDTVGRFGGEEFLVVMPDTSAATAERLMRDLVQRIAGTRMGDIAPRLSVTASGGLALYQPGEEMWAVVERARRAAREANQAGGNRAIYEAQTSAPAGRGRPPRPLERGTT